VVRKGAVVPAAENEKILEQRKVGNGSLREIVREKNRWESVGGKPKTPHGVETSDHHVEVKTKEELSHSRTKIKENARGKNFGRGG